MKKNSTRRALPLILGSLILLSLAAVFIVLQLRNDRELHEAAEQSAQSGMDQTTVAGSAEPAVSTESVAGTDAQTSGAENSSFFDELRESIQNAQSNQNDDGQPKKPVVKLKTQYYPDFTEAGLEAEMLTNPLHPRMRTYSMLFDSESVILSEPVSLSALPEGADQVTLWFSYDPVRVGDRLGHMQVMRYDPDSDTATDPFHEMTGAEIDEAQHRICIPVSETGVYYIYDTNAYDRLSGNPTDIPMLYRNPTVGFETVFPAEVMFMQYGISFMHIEEQFLPDEVCRYDNDGARHIAPLIFIQNGTDPGIYDFRMEWVTDCTGADAAAEAFINEALNPEGRRRKVVRNDSGTLPDGTYRRLIMTTAPAHGDSPAQAELFAVYDLKQGEIITVHYALDPAAKERLYDTLTDSLDTFRKTGTALQ